MRHRFWLASTALAVVTCVARAPIDVAHAADPSLKAAPEAPAAPWSWSGFYVGGHAGYGWANDPFHQVISNPGDPTLNGIASRGSLGGFQAGANWQRGRGVGGLEIDLSDADIKGATSIFTNMTTSGGVLAASTSDKLALVGSARARLGYLVAPDVLLYGTGGLAFMRLDKSFLQNQTFPTVPAFFAVSSASSSWLSGWVAGVGGEMRLGQSNWLARLEYLHYDFGDLGSSSSLQSTSGVVTSSDVQPNRHPILDVVRAGLSYQLGGPSAFAEAPAASGASGSWPMAFKAAPRQLAATADWGGFYFGAHAGYGWGHDPFTNPINSTVPVTLTGIDSRGGLAGFQAGANWQGRLGFVAGAEIDLSATDIKGSTSAAATTGTSSSQVTQTDRFDWLGSVRARLGYAVMPDLLLYGTGGLAWTRFAPTTDETDANGTNVNVSSQTAPLWLFGWVAGIGAETRLAGSNWVARLEYLHYDFGDAASGASATTTTTTNGVVTSATVQTFGRLTADVVRAGLSYQLGGEYAASAPGAGPMWTKAPAARAVAPTWTGFYLGAHAGYGWSREAISATAADLGLGPTPALTLAGELQAHGGLGGFQADANWQAGRFVGGLELDLSATGIKGTLTQSASTTSGGMTNTASASQSDELELIGSTRVRVGYLVSADALLYATGGLASMQVSQGNATLQVSAGSPTTITSSMSTGSSWRFGWVAGIGGETRLAASNWFARLEYLHYDFGGAGAQSIAFTGAPTFAATASNLTADEVRVGLSYKID
jgi:opacity protein-like surface antigen